MLFHEALIRPPRNASGLNGVPFGAERDLVRMQVMKPQLIKQGFLDDFVREQKRLDGNCFHRPAKRAREMSVDEDRMAVDTVAGNIGDIVRTIDDSYAPTQRFNYIHASLSGEGHQSVLRAPIRR